MSTKITDPEAIIFIPAEGGVARLPRCRASLGAKAKRLAPSQGPTASFSENYRFVGPKEMQAHRVRWNRVGPAHVATSPEHRSIVNPLLAGKQLDDPIDAIT
jgi:hypothetical protein